MTTSPWIEHHGDPMPVAGDVRVDIKRRDGGTINGWPAKLWCWEHGGIAGDIIAYRIVARARALLARLEN